MDSNSNNNSNKRKMAEMLSNNMSLNLPELNNDASISPEILKALEENTDCISDKHQISSDHDFMNLTKLNNPVLSPDYSLSSKLIINFEDLNKPPLTKDVFQDCLDSCKTLDGSVATYQTKLYHTLYYILCDLYVEKMQGEKNYKKEINLIEALFSVILTQHQNSGFVLNELVKALLQKKVSRSLDVTDHRKKLKLCIESFLRDSKPDYNLSESNNEVIHNNLTVSDYFGEAHSNLYEQIKPFFEIGSIFKSIVSPTNVTFKSITKSYIRTTKNNQKIDKEALKITFTLPCFVKLDNKQIGEWKYCQISEDDSGDIINAIMRDIRFANDISIECYETISLIRPKEMKMILVHENVIDKELVTKDCLEKDLQDNLYGIIDHVKISVTDDNDKHSLKSWPMKLIKPQSITESICFINFDSTEPIDKLRTLK